MNKWVLSFGFVEAEYSTFKEAFQALQKMWKEKGTMLLIETVWIKEPDSQIPMFYNAICKEADKQNLP